jgi:hypothetical protein
VHALGDDAHVPLELLPAAGRGRLDRVRRRREARQRAGEDRLDGMQQVVDLVGLEVRVETATHRVDGAVGAGEEAQRALAHLDRGLVAGVGAGDHARVDVDGSVEPLAADHAHERIGERRGQRGERVRREERVGVGEDQHVAARRGHAAVQGRRLPGPRILAQQADAPIGVRAHDRVGAVA